MRYLGVAIALLSSVAPAQADPADYNRVIAFGDSLQDNGNLYKNTTPAQPPAPYYNGRFSNGPTWIELLSNPAKSGNPSWSSMDTFWSPPSFTGIPNTGSTTQNVNAAVGGAGTVPGSSLNPVPSVQLQINTFAAAGGTFGANDLVSIQGGANDFIKFFTNNPTPTAAEITTQAITTGGNEASNIRLAIQDGAKTILVSNLPNLGATPYGLALSPAGGMLASVTYNATLNTATQQLAAANPSVNLVQMDWYGALNVILANPAAFGFTNTTQGCVNVGAACIATNAQGYLFWDSVHPTEAAQQLLARYAALLLSTQETGKAVAALPQVSLSNRLDASDIIFRRAANPAAEGPGGLYAEVIGSTASFNGVNAGLYGGTGYDYSLGGVRAGFDASSGPIAFGAALAYQAGTLSGRALSGDISTGQIDAYALSRYGVFFAGVEGGVSFDQYDKLRRATGFPTVVADGGTQGVDYSIDGTIGTQYQLGAFTLTPAVRAGYASINVNGFTEAAPILALQYSDQNVSTGFWTARMRATANFFGLPQAVVYGEAGYEGLFGTSDSYTAKLAFNTAQAVGLNDNLDARGFFVKAGVGGYVSGGIRLSGEYELSTEDGNGNIQSGRLRITIPLQANLSLKD